MSVHSAAALLQDHTERLLYMRDLRVVSECRPGLPVDLIIQVAQLKALRRLYPEPVNTAADLMHALAILGGATGVRAGDHAEAALLGLEAVLAEAHHEPQPPTREDCVAMVVADTEPMRALLGRRLSGLGFVVIGCSATRALRTLGGMGERPAVACIDTVGAHGDGKALAALQESLSQRQVPVLTVTAAQKSAPWQAAAMAM